MCLKYGNVVDMQDDVVEIYGDVVEMDYIFCFVIFFFFCEYKLLVFIQFTFFLKSLVPFKPSC